MSNRVGVDVGGTFTDLILQDSGSDRYVVGKVPTTSDAPDVGVMTAVSSFVSPRALEDAAFFLHATTVGLNAVLERRGATVGLLATAGFRDVLEIGRGDRGDPYDLFWRRPEPIVARHLRLPVRERILADGRIHMDLVEEDVAAAAAVFAEYGVDAVAVAFINAYANPLHEERAAAVLREVGFDGVVTTSTTVSRNYREYERTSTTVVDAFVRRRMSDYLGRLAGSLGDKGFRGTALVTRSGGGAMTFDQADVRPFETIMSGPVAGAEGAARLARRMGLASVVTADVGGTSFDTCLITDGRPRLMWEGSVDGLPVQAPWVDVRSIGAGGGSVAYVDVGGLLRVGPRSAGAQPGPACYGRGGTEPTVTDAALELGMLGAGTLAGGLALDRSAASKALHGVAGPLGMEIPQAAAGIVRIAAASMADAIREVTVEQGEDPRDASLIAYGGAGPLFGSVLARELEIPRVVIPPHAGNFSALALLDADLVQTASRTRIFALDTSAITAIETLLGECFVELDQRSPDSGESRRREVSLDLRYVGQEHTLTIDVDHDAGHVGAQAEEIEAAFGISYRRTFGHDMSEAVEVVTVRVSDRVALEGFEPAQTVGNQDDSEEPAVDADAYSFAADQWNPFTIEHRSRLQPGIALEGPAVVLEATATTYLDTGDLLTVGDDGSMVIEVAEGV
jgi:N-methylhydantoinase A